MCISCCKSNSLIGILPYSTVSSIVINYFRICEVYQIVSKSIRCWDISISSIIDCTHMYVVRSFCKIGVCIWYICPTITCCIKRAICILIYNISWSEYPTIWSIFKRITGSERYIECRNIWPIKSMRRICFMDWELSVNLNHISLNRTLMSRKFRFKSSGTKIPNTIIKIRSVVCSNSSIIYFCWTTRTSFFYTISCLMRTWSNRSCCVGVWE